MFCRCIYSSITMYNNALFFLCLPVFGSIRPAHHRPLITICSGEKFHHTVHRTIKRCWSLRVHTKNSSATPEAIVYALFVWSVYFLRCIIIIISSVLDVFSYGVYFDFRCHYSWSQHTRNVLFSGPSDILLVLQFTYIWAFGHTCKETTRIKCVTVKNELKTLWCIQ